MGFRRPKNGCNPMGRSWDIGKVNNLAMCGVWYLNCAASRAYNLISFWLVIIWLESDRGIVRYEENRFCVDPLHGERRLLFYCAASPTSLKFCFREFICRFFVWVSVRQNMASIWWVDREIWKKQNKCPLSTGYLWTPPVGTHDRDGDCDSLWITISSFLQGSNC